MRHSSTNIVIIAVLLLGGCSAERAPLAIPNPEDEAARRVAWVSPDWLPTPITYTAPSHPAMAPAGLNSMHADSYNSDVHAGVGPTTVEIAGNSRLGDKRVAGQCATITFAGDGKLLMLCAKLTGFRIQLLAPRSLELLAEYRMPMRSSSFQALRAWDRSIIMGDSSGAYFYLDDQDRVVLADSLNWVHRIAHRQLADGSWELFEEQSWDLSSVVPSDCLRPTNPFPSGECDVITGVLPDYDGDLWWASRYGRVGIVDVASGTVSVIRLADEEIQNGFAVAADGVYIVSDHALYAFDKRAGEPQLRWREAYDRGSERKVGSINQGSGTTPTLFSDYVTITDNADSQINLLVYRRSAEHNRLVCKQPLFSPGQSATDNSMIAFGNAVLVENNAGFSSVHGINDWSAIPGGVERIDVNGDQNSCTTVWRSPIKAPSSVPKLAAASGVAYFYAYTLALNGEQLWSLVGLDVASGEKVIELPTGSGPAYNNNWAPTMIAADGTVYVGTSRGVVALWELPLLGSVAGD